jgi:hypothetical protein
LILQEVFAVLRSGADAMQQIKGAAHNAHSDSPRRNFVNSRRRHSVKIKEILLCGKSRAQRKNIDHQKRATARVKRRVCGQPINPR